VATLQNLRIVVGLDFSETSQEALRYAVEEAFHRLGEKPHLHVAVVVDDGATSVGRRQRREQLDDAVEAARADATDMVDAARRARTGAGADAPRIPATIHVRLGDPVDQIVSVATEIAAHLVIVGTHGRRGVRRLLLGSVAERVARMAPCPVIVVRPRDEKAFAKVVEPEPPPPEGVVDTGGVEPHRYSYTSPASLQPPPNHLL
jgi:nucleotide-binding universal stress UspA family protein